MTVEQEKLDAAIKEALWVLHKAVMHYGSRMEERESIRDIKGPAERLKAAARLYYWRYNNVKGIHPAKLAKVEQLARGDECDV